MEYDLLTFVGRIQPMHKEHERIINEALSRSKKVLLLLGSAGSPRTIRNMFTYQERYEMIKSVFDTENLIIKPLYDKTYRDAAWIKQVQEIATQVGLDVANGGGFHNSGLRDIKIGLIGASKDDTSYYLKLFPQWSSVDVPVKNLTNSTEIRNKILVNDFENLPVSPEIKDFILNFSNTEDFENLQLELEYVNRYKKSWANIPYPVKHVTVDAVVEQSGHILMVKRKSYPGKGLWALPGGHVNEYETLEDATFRELREETGIKVPEPVLRGSVVNCRTFDSPHRSTLGRVITEARHIKLKDDVKLPRVKGMDDAEKAKWIPISEIREELCFDDHFHMISTFINL